MSEAQSSNRDVNINCGLLSSDINKVKLTEKAVYLGNNTIKTEDIVNIKKYEHTTIDIFKNLIIMISLFLGVFVSFKVNNIIYSTLAIGIIIYASYILIGILHKTPYKYVNIDTTHNSYRIGVSNKKDLIKILRL